MDSSVVNQGSGLGRVAREGRILLVDGDRDTLGSVYTLMANAGYEVHCARDGLSGWQLYQKYRPHLAVLGGVMPGMDGWTLCQRIREADDTRVILLSDQSDKTHRLRGYMCGCDYYLAKPCDADELLARTRALLWRAGKCGLLGSVVVLDGGRVHIHLDKRSVTVGGRPVQVTSTEYRMLDCLAGKRGGVASHGELLHAAWGSHGVAVDDSYPAGRNEVKVYITHLRRKLGDAARAPRIIQTVPTKGYRLAVGVG